MISKLTIHGYKSIEDLSIGCSRVNLLTGSNMSGKTAVIEAMLLGGWKHTAGLPSLDAEFSDVHNDRAEKPITIETVDSSGILRRIAFCGDGTVISSDRPADTFIYIPLIKTHLGQRDGLFIADSVAPGKGSSKGVCLADGATHLPDGMGEWVERVTRLSLAHDNSDPKGHFSFQRRENGRLVRRTVSSAGVIRAVKIIYVCLASPKNAVICVEQPEAFLSPAEQSELAKFLYHIAADGHQVFIETNSENVFNALRTEIVKKEIRAEDVSVNYLVLDRHTYTTKCNPVMITQYGSLQGMNETMSLDGFFDQYSKDLDVMLGL